MSWGKGREKQAEREDYARTALLRRRAERWRMFAGRELDPAWTPDAIWAAGVWAHSSTLRVYVNVGGLHCLGGGGGDAWNMDDPAPSGSYPQALACARAAEAKPQPGQVEVLAAKLSKLAPVALLTYAQAAHAGVPAATDLLTGEYRGPSQRVLDARAKAIRLHDCDFCGGPYEGAPQPGCTQPGDHS